MADKKKNGVLIYARFSGIALQMLIIIYLGAQLGRWIDAKWNNENELMYKIISLLAIFISIGNVIRQILNVSKEQEHDSK
ncbi:MAG: AtpZ/AtpI family protein [Flavobacteriales bacterium]